MESGNRLIGGLNSDTNPSLQPDNTFRSAYNFVPVSEGGNIYSVVNENGTVRFNNISFPDGFTIIGHSSLNNEIIVVLADKLGNSQTGIIRSDSDLDVSYGNYHPIAPVNQDGTVPVDNSELGFTRNHPVDCVSRKLINGHRILYFTDNNISFGSIDLDDPPKVGNVKDSVKLISNQSLPKFRIKEIIDNTPGTFKPGIYQLVTRYVTESGDVTTFGLPSGMIPMVPSFKANGVDKYQGGYPEDADINKNVVMTISNIDTNYAELEICAIYYDSSESIFRCTVLNQLPIVSDTIEYVFTGIQTENNVEITREEVRQIPINYDRAKCIEQKDNRLFLSNLSSANTVDDDQMQKIANAVNVRYRVNEVQYSGRGLGGNAPTTQFVPIEAYTSDQFTVSSVFTKNVTTADSADLAISIQGTSSYGFITITDATLVSDTESFTIGAYDMQPAVTFTAENTASGNPNTFLTDLDINILADNIVQAVSKSTDVEYFTAYYDSFNGKILFIWKFYGSGANGTTVTDTSAGLTSTAFANGNNTPTEVTCISSWIDGSTVNAVFTEPVPSDALMVFTDIISEDSDNYTTGSGDDGTVILDEPTSISDNPVQAGFTDYLNEEFTFELKTYKRGEVYSLGFVLLFKNGSYSSVYHIPGRINSNTVSTGKSKDPDWTLYNQTDSSSGFLGCYVSETKYPENQRYPGNLEGDDIVTDTVTGYERNIRHHLIPELINEPSFKTDSGFTSYIRPISLEFEFTSAIPSNVLEDVAEIIFVRERRNNKVNKSIYAQGLVNNGIVQADNCDNNGLVTGSTLSGGTLIPNPKSNYILDKKPFFNNLQTVSVSGSDANRSEGYQNAGIWYANCTGGKYNENFHEGRQQSTAEFKNHVFFHSPETILNTGFNLTEDTTVGASLKPVMSLKGNYKRLNFYKDEWYFSGGSDYITNNFHADFYGDYLRIDTSFSSATETLIKNSRKADPGKNRYSSINDDEVISLSSRWSSESYELVLNDNLDDNFEHRFKLDCENYINNDPTIPPKSGETVYQSKLWKGGSDIPSNAYDGIINDVLNTDGLKQYLYEVSFNNINQYDQLSAGSFIIAGRKTPVDDSGNFVTYYDGIYGGDVFITKFTYNDGMLLRHASYWRIGTSSANRPDRATSKRDYNHIDGKSEFQQDGGEAQGYDFRWCTMYFVESEINTYYRHRIESQTIQDYYPNAGNLHAMMSSYLPYLGNINSYNTQYSYENNVKEFYTKSSTTEVVSSFENRTIYSAQAAEDDTLDAYKIFLQNDYYDLPSNTGMIWDSFIFNNDLYLHTPKSLWKTFAEPAATLQSTDISDVVLGTGNLFARPSVEMLTTEGGYGGTICQFGGTHTQLGYIFPDVLQGKIFALAIGQGLHLKELSQKGASTFIHQNLADGIIDINGEIDLSNVTTSNSNLIDNPFIGIGINGGYDYKLKRYFLVKHGGFTLTYSVSTDSWFSFHDYSPNLIMSYDNRVLFVKEDEGSDLWEMNLGLPGSYFDATYNSSIEVVCAQPQFGEKSFHNFKVHSISYKDSIKIRDDNFSSVECFNDKNNSGRYSLVNANYFNPVINDGEIAVKFKNNEYRMIAPRDGVVDNSLDITDPDNLYIPFGNVPQDSKYNFRERIKGNYMISKFIYDNSEGRVFILNGINTIFNKNIR